jgi:hypothetical protein
VQLQAFATTPNESSLFDPDCPLAALPYSSLTDQVSVVVRRLASEQSDLKQNP